MLTGHHRNYSPIMSKAREIVHSGALGSVVAVVGTALFYKPDDYFEVGGGWRRQPGGGPILLNLIHEVNNLLLLVGDIVRVQAATSNATRGHAVEDTAAMVFTFANGALGTFLLSDTAASPRSWEQTSQENTSYDSHLDEDCYHIAGTRGSLSVPTMRLKVYEGTRSWWEPFASSVADVSARIRWPTRSSISPPSSAARWNRCAVAGTGSRHCWWSMRLSSPPAPGGRSTSRAEPPGGAAARCAAAVGRG